MEQLARKKIDFAAAAETLKRTLSLEGSPVAVLFASGKDQIPEGLAEIENTVRHCQMVNLARKEGRMFFAPAPKHECMGGSWALGLREQTESLRTGQFYYRLGKFESWAACKRTIDRIPHVVPPGSTFATCYAPLEKTPFPPHVVIVVAEPRAMLKLAQASLYRLGGRIEASFSGIQSVCSDVTASTYLSGKANFSLGCDGSRRFSGIENSEMVMGFPGEYIEEMVEAIQTVTTAPGSK